MLFVVAMAMADTCNTATIINCLRLFVVVNGSDGRHVCAKYHGHTYYYQQLIGS